MKDAGCKMQDARCRMQDGWVTWLLLARAASGLSERTKTWVMIKGREMVSSFRP